MAQKRVKWPCGACANIHICKYETSWKLGGDNFFCPVLRTYLDQDNTNYQLEFSGGSETMRDKRVSSGYLDTINEGAQALKDRLEQAYQRVYEMSEETIHDQRLKTISCLAFFGIDQNKIADILGIPQSTFYRRYRGK